MLTRVNDMNRDFLCTVAHELKTPLTAISGYAQLIGRQIERGRLWEKTPERLLAIQSEADRLAEMVARLMEYTYGQIHDAEMTAVDLDMFKSAEAVLSPVCAKRHNSLSLHITCPSPTTWACCWHGSRPGCARRGAESASFRTGP